MEYRKEFEETFNLEDSIIALENLQQATRMMSQVRQRLELELEEEKSLNGIEKLKKVISENTYSRKLASVSYSDELACSSQSLSRKPSTSNIIAKLMGLETIPVRKEQPASNIEMLKARMLPLVEKRTEANRKTLREIVEAVISKGDMENSGNTYYNYPSRNLRVDQDAPPIVILKAPQLQEEFLSNQEKRLVKRWEKPEAEPTENRKALTCEKHRQPRKMEKVKPAPRSQVKLSGKASAKLVDTPRSGKKIVVSKGESERTNDNLVTSPKLSCKPTKVKKSEEKLTRNVDKIKLSTGNIKHRDVTNISRTRKLPVKELGKHMAKNVNSKQCKQGHKREDPNPFCEVTVKTVKCAKKSRPLSDDNAKDIKLLLQSSQSFISYAQERCRLTYYQTKYRGKRFVPNDANVLLDCAKELIDRKNHQEEFLHHPITRTKLSSFSVFASMDQLVEEIGNEVKKLRTQRKVGESVDSSQYTVHAMIKEDLKCNNYMLNAMWDEGWLDWICLEEVDYVIGPLERLVFCGLVEELVLDLVH